MMRLWAVMWWPFTASLFEGPHGGVVVPGVDESQAVTNAKRVMAVPPTGLVKVVEVPA